MEQSEVEILVNELETRVDRLRSLYDQYFMGIERMPPAVPHKDVDRRVQVLRREQIRNTGLRFRFQMVVQRYNTYQSYWIRICRQIEDGTYKRDVIRAKKKEKEIERIARESLPPQSIDITNDLELEEMGELEEVFDEPEEAPTVAKAARPAGLNLGAIDDLDDLLDEKPTQQLKAPPPAAEKPAPPPIKKPPPPMPAAKPAVPPVVPPVVPAVAIRPAPVAPAAGAARPVWKKVSAPAAGVSIPVATPNKPIPREPAPPPKEEPKPKEAAPPKEEPKPEPKPATRPRPEPAKPKPLGPADLTDARVRQIYAEYVRAKRSQNESTAAITYETMSKSIRDSSEKLREKHGGKKVDFEVQVKDGKTILKPVVKSEK